MLRLSTGQNNEPWCAAIIKRDGQPIVQWDCSNVVLGSIPATAHVEQHIESLRYKGVQVPCRHRVSSRSELQGQRSFDLGYGW